jgi:hypothetical protein
LHFFYFDEGIFVENEEILQSLQKTDKNACKTLWNLVEWRTVKE